MRSRAEALIHPIETSLNAIWRIVGGALERGKEWYNRHIWRAWDVERANERLSLASGSGSRDLEC